VISYPVSCERSIVGEDTLKSHTQTARVGDLDIRYTLTGEGHPLVLIIGLLGSTDWWEPAFIDSLARRYRVLVFDNRGAGNTVTPDDTKITIPLMAGDTAGLMDAVGFKSAYVLGFSMGGMIAQELTLLYPEKVEKLALCSTNCGKGGSVFAGRDVLKKLADRSGTPVEQVERFCSLFFCEEWLEIHGEDGEEFKNRYLESPANDHNATLQFMAMVTFAACERLPRIEVPTLVACGTGDLLLPPENSKIIQDRIPGSRLVMYEGAGHGIMWERREDFLRDLVAFLEDEA
jgi:pimeloyl-ACP methyl ester carboxylesterase